MSRTEVDVSKIVATARKLLDKGNANMAMAYFWRAAEVCAERNEWDLAAQYYERSGYCYEMDGRWDRAAEDYEELSL